MQGNLPTKQEIEDPSDSPKQKPTTAREIERFIKNEVKRKKPKTEEEAKFITQNAMKFTHGPSRQNGQTSFETPDGEKYTIIQLNNAEETDPDLEFFKGLLPQIKVRIIKHFHFYSQTDFGMLFYETKKI